MRATRRIKRLGLVALALVLLGAVTSVGVALGGARYLPPHPRRTTVNDFSRECFGLGEVSERPWVRSCLYLVVGWREVEWTVRHIEGEPGWIERVREPDGAREEGVRKLPGYWAPKATGAVDAPDWCRVSGIYSTLNRPPPESGDCVSVVEAGWPLSCFRGASRLNDPPTCSDQAARTALVGFPLDEPWRTYFVPTRPLWGGLAVNTALYASLWWVLLLAPRQLRRALRRRRGRCARCGYDRAGLAPSAPCPECGQQPHALVGPGPLIPQNP